jgi:CRISPR-associated protein Cst1
MSIGLRYTGHPFVDVALATMAGFAGKKSPEEITLEDLINVADYLKDIFCNIRVVQGQLTTLFPNSGFTQPSYTLEQKIAYADRLLYGFLPTAPKLDVPCTFFPEKLAYLYAHRQFMPLLSAEGTVNFLPEGARTGIPMSGEAVLAVTAMILGAFRCKNWLIFHEISPSDETDMTLVLAREALRENSKMIQLLRDDPDSKWATLKKVRQVYIDTILAAQSKINRRFAKLGDITGYHFSNYGPNPQIEIVRLESSVWDFIGSARYDAEHAWKKFFAVGQVSKDYNQAYDVLFDLPYRYDRFMKLLKKVADWTLTEIFLRKVVKMHQKRIQLLKDLGDRFVDYMSAYERDGKGGIKLGFYYKVMRAKKPGELRSAILEACDTTFRKGSSILMTTEEYVLAFENAEDRYENWTLPRDLVVMRMLEKLPLLGVSLEDGEAEAQLPSDEAEQVEES